MMLSSLLIRLAMLSLTIGVVFWIGWVVPQSRNAEADREPEAGQEVTAHPSTEPAVVIAAPASGITARPQASARAAAGTLDLNGATEREFESLPGIGPVLAERIAEYRQTHGPFQDIEQLRQVKGIGKKKFDRIRSLVHVAPTVHRPQKTRGAT